MTGKKIEMLCLRVFIVLLLFLLSVSLLPSKMKNSQTLDLQSELKEELLENLGDYDNKKIVLQNTNKSLAKEIANRLDAKLRITNDGSFATLTLNSNNTILDVVSNPDNKDILKYFSIDYKTTISEILCEEDEDETNLQVKEPNYTITDPLYNNQSYLDYINLSDIWNYSKGENITIAVIDTGIDYDHPEFEGKISEYSYNATEDKIVKDYIDSNGNYDFSLVDDEQGHGTAVTGVIAAGMNNGIGITGISPNATIITIKAECNEKGQFKNSSDLVFGLYYAIERDVDIVNMSFGGLTNIYNEATKLAVDSDIICVAAAGNDSTAAPTYPAADPNVIGVGALAENSFELASYSNYGENTNVVAPGTVYTTLKDGKYGVMNGTSFASPIVASIIALQMSKEKYNYTYLEFQDKCELLYASSYDLGDKGNDFYFGYGAIDTSAFILEERKTVTFNYLTEEIENTTHVFIKGHPLQNIPEPERNYAVFDGWYYDIHCIEEYNLYSDSWVNNITLYCNWVNEDDGVPYTYVELEDGTIEIRSYTGKRRYITIPDYIDEKIVSSIGKDAFKNQTRLRAINLPSNLKTIKDNAFENCINLTSIYIPDSATSIGNRAFKNNIRLYNVNFNSTSKLEKIGEEAFSNCSSLVRFDIPVNVSEVNGLTFLCCTNLKQVNASINSKYFISIDGILFNKSKTSLLVYPAGLTNETYELLDSVRTLDIASFAYCNINTINLNNVTSIGDKAFEYSKLDSIDILDTVTSIGEEAFSCSQISNVSIGKGVTILPESIFQNTINLNKIIIPNNIIKINKSAFSRSALNKVIFEENSNLMSIGSFAFSNTNLNSIDLPNSVVSIGDSAFEQSNLNEIKINDNSKLVTIGDKAFNETNISNINLPSHLEFIGSFAFGNTKLTEVNIPASVTNLSSSAFASCHSLENVYIDEFNEKYTDIDGVVYTKDLLIIHEYPSGKVLSEYTILDDIVKVEEYAFYGSNNLNYIYLPEALTEIGEYAFACNENLYNITIPDNVTLISRYVFYNDYNLSYIEILNNSKLDRLSYASFSNCGINSFTVPSNVSTISQYVFAGCPDLTSITFASNSRLESISAYQFIGCNNLQTITFESGSMLTSIQAHSFEGMDRLYSINFNDAKVENIDSFAFRYCSSLSNITIPETVTNIGRFAFYGCSSLSNITIPENVEFIGRYAFNLTNNLNIYFESSVLPLNLQENWDYGINGYYVGVNEVYTEGDFELAKLNNDTIAIIKYNGTLETLDLTILNLGTITQIGGNAFNRSSVKEIVLPNTIKSIEKNAFSNSSLETINIPSSVVYINDYAFYNSNLNNIIIEENSNLEKIGSYAFSLCDNLTSINIPHKVSILGSYAFSQSGLEKVVFDTNINLTEISEGLFQGTKLQSVNIPNSVTLINNSAFRNIETLKEVNFGTSSLQIMSNVFYNTGLTSVTIPSNIEYIGEYAFVGLNNLNEFIVDSNNPYYASVDGVLYSKDLKKLIAYPSNKEGSFIVPNYVEVIGFGAFENSKLESVNFEEGINLLTIGYRAFYNAKNLKEITIPESVVSIDYYAFAMCKSLETVNFSVNSKLTGIYEGAFYGCISLSDIVIPDEIYEISDYAFYGCLQLDRLPISENNNLLGIYNYAFANSGIEELVLPESLLDIGSYAFKGIKATNIVIPDVNKEQLIIGIGAFQDCNELEEITISFIGASLDDEKLGWFGYIFGAGSGQANSEYVPESLKKVIITEGQTILPDYAFYNIQTIEEIDMPSTIKYLGSNCMENSNAKYSLKSEIESLYFTSLYDHMFGKFVEEVNISSNVKFIDSSTFINCTLLKKIIIPSSIEYINYETFKNCTSLEHITISDGVKSIGDSSFEGCSSLIEITIPNSVTNIEGSAFKNCTSLENITIPNSVTNIGGGAFENCTSLENITIPNSVKSIEDQAFSSCAALTAISIPNSVTSIGSFAFSNCTSLENITIPNSVINIGHSAFIGCSSLRNVVFEEDSNLISIEDATFSGCRALTNIILPDSITSIGDSAFGSCTSLKSIILLNNVKSIGCSAFSYCLSLVSIKIPKSVTSIGSSAFESCSSLKSVIFEEDSNLLNIQESAFKDCSSLVNLTIPESVTSIGGSGYYSAFYGCDSLYEVINNSSFVFVPGSTDYGYIAYNATMVNNKGTILYKEDVTLYEYFTTEDGFKFLNINDQYYLVSYLGKEEIPVVPLTINGQTYSFKFMDVTLKRIELSQEFTRVVGFNKCSSLEEIIIPNTVTSIEISAFENCTSLTNITIPNSVTNIGSSAFYYCRSLKEITIPESVTDIGNNAFYGCEKLKIINNYSEFYFECGSENYGHIAYYANNVINFKNPNNYIETEDGFVFNIQNDLYYLISYKGNSERPILPLEINGKSYRCEYMDETLKNIELCDEFTKISNLMFKNCSNLNSIVIPSTVIEIEPYAFENCIALGKIIFKENSNLTNIGRYAFSKCVSLKDISIPSNVKNISDYVFNGCISLESIVIPKNLSIIDYFTFQDCTSLNNVTFEEESKLTAIESLAFSNCTSLTNITIPNSVTSIGSMVFYNCTSLTSITIPNSVTSIGSNAFSNCTSLRSIVIPNSVTSIAKSAFYGCTSLTNVTIPNSVKSIEDQAFSSCAALTAISIPNSVTNIGGSAFENCTSLTNITFEEESKLTAIEGRAFSNCTSLTAISIPNSVTSIGSFAFSNCTSLTNITFEEESKLTAIEGQAFSNCTSLTNLIIPESVTSIGSNAFYGCDNLYEVINNSDLVFTAGSTDYGCIAYYALIVNNKGIISYKDNGTSFITEEGLKFIITNDGYYLLSYLGESDRPIIPLTINGQSYSFKYMDETLKNIELSSEFTNIIGYMFANCEWLESIVIPESVTSIGEEAFSNCRSLKEVVIPNSVTKINNNAFVNTPYFENNSYTIDDCLYIENILIEVSEGVEFYQIPDNISVISIGAFNNCYNLKYVEILGGAYSILINCPNIETILIKNIKGKVQSYFYTGIAPITLNNIILIDCSNIMDEKCFQNITNVNIYVDKYETDVMWDHDYPNWNNGNKVYYNGEWINAEFYDENHSLLSSEYYSISQIIKQPIMNEPIENGYINKFIGWDIDGDGSADAIPATSNVNITAKAVYSVEKYTYTVNYYDLDGKTVIGTQYYSYNDELQLIDNPTKKGYTFYEWTNFPSDLKVVDDLKIYSSWSHLGDGHIYEESTVSPTCTEKGYTLHKCSVCDEEYKDNYTDELGHSYSEWIIDITPSCETEGLKHRICSECSHNEEEVIAISGHSYETIIIEQSSCEKQGLIKHTCSICDDTYIEYTNLLEHNYEKKYVSKSLFKMLIEFILNIFYGYEGEKAYYYECVNCKHIMLDNENTSKTASVQGVCEHSECAWETAIESTCENEGYETYKCNDCDETISLKTTDKLAHTDQIITGYDSTHTQTGLTDGVICSECGEVIVEQEIIPVKPLDANFKIKSAFLNVTQDINIVYTTTIPEEYTDFYMIFTFMNLDFKVEDCFIDNGRYCFKFDNIRPQYMGENIVARLYATVNGEEVFVEQSSYSVKQYCVNTLNKYVENEKNKAIRALLSDLLVYGAASQKYVSYNIENLVTNGLTLNSSEYIPLTNDYNKQLFIGTASEKVIWSSASLYMENSMALRLGFKVVNGVNIDNIKLEVSVNGNKTYYNVKDLSVDSDGVYRIYYRGVMATEFNDVITARFIESDVQIGRTLQYSINTYIYKKQNDANTLLVELLKSVYNYGKSAENYKKYLNN